MNTNMYIITYIYSTIFIRHIEISISVRICIYYVILEINQSINHPWALSPLQGVACTHNILKHSS